MIVKPFDMSNDRAVLELLELQLKSYTVEATLIGFVDIPPLLDTVSILRQSNERFVGCYEENALVGAAAYTVGPEETMITRMMVHPDHFRKGIASQLIVYMEEAAPAGIPIRVSAGTRNEPAMMLYSKHGFVPEREMKVARFFTITVFVKRK